MRFKRVADFRQQPRTDQMAVSVVHLFEVIKIDENQRKFVVVALRSIDFRIENEAHVPRVVERRAIIGNGQFVNALYVPRIFERDRGKIGKRFE